MIENQPEFTKGMESAMKALEQAKARVAEEKRKASVEKRKKENQHKYMMGGIVHKYFPDCYQFEEDELNVIIGTGLRTAECRNAIAGIRKQNGPASAKTEYQVKGSDELEASEKPQ